eukprot:1700908-Pyramimonas_sp.AAC.1
MAHQSFRYGSHHVMRVPLVFLLARSLQPVRKDLAKMETRSPAERDVVPAKAARGTRLGVGPVTH